MKTPLARASISMREAVGREHAVVFEGIDDRLRRQLRGVDPGQAAAGAPGRGGDRRSWQRNPP